MIAETSKIVSRLRRTRGTIGGVWCPDLGASCPIADGARVRAVGWLSADHEIISGEVAPAVVDALRLLVRAGYCPVAAAGFHTCELCSGARESANVLVPSGDVLFVAPAMIVHYIEAHGYRPLDVFVAAVTACPVPPSAAYYDALRPFGGVWGYVDDAWSRLLDAELTRATDAQRRAAATSRRKGFDWGDGR